MDRLASRPRQRRCACSEPWLQTPANQRELLHSPQREERLRSDRRRIKSTASKLLELIAPGDDETGNNYARAVDSGVSARTPNPCKGRHLRVCPERTVPGCR